MSTDLQRHILFETGVGFEPTCAYASGFADRSFRPLRQPVKIPVRQRATLLFQVIYDPFEPFMNIKKPDSGFESGFLFLIYMVT